MLMIVWFGSFVLMMVGEAVSVVMVRFSRGKEKKKKILKKGNWVVDRLIPDV